MSVIHHTTLKPTKLELLASWLPTRPWYLAEGNEPRLTRAGGFRLDDPEGEVGIEFMAVSDLSGDHPVVYQVPMTYRGAPLEGAGHALIGTTEHGVLGRRWIYDGCHDPVLVTQLLALILGKAQPQAQSVSDTPDPTVTHSFTGAGVTATTGFTSVVDGQDVTNLIAPPTAAPGSPVPPARGHVIQMNRVLKARQNGPTGDAVGALGHVAARWLLPDGTQAHGLYAVLRETEPRPTAQPARRAP